MNYRKHIFKKFIVFVICVGFTVLSSCVDDDIKEGGYNNYDPAQDPGMVCLPLSIAMDFASVASRAEEAKSNDADWSENPQLSYGSDSDHIIDFDLPNECFAIFFQTKTNDKGEQIDKVQYIKPVYLNSQLGSGTEQPAPNIEYRVPVVTYIPVDDTDIVYKDENTKEILYYKPKLTKILVVLNGGKIYKKFVDEIYKDPETLKEVKENITLEDVLKITWDNPAAYKEGAWNKDEEYSDGRIGFNVREHFTLTSSAYWKEEEDRYYLMTATPIKAKAYQSLTDYLDYLEHPDKFNIDEELDDFPDKAVSVPVERMVSRFFAPTFQTEVIGAERVFRPDQNAMPVIIHKFEGDQLKKTDKNWRIHLLGWSINGDESKSYVFKNIGNIGIDYKNGIDKSKINYQSWSTWNDPVNFRSYWSIDPHYYSSTNDFYPWQFRKAADRSDIISIQAAINHKDANGNSSPIKPALRYNTFNDILNEWQWRDVLHLHENTFYPDGDWNNPTNEPNNYGNYLDGRASILAGPNLLIAGEVFVEVDNPDEDYAYTSANVKFKRVDHLYADRIRRYYYEEKDWLKMFLQDINQSLGTLEYMDFPVYNWDETSSGKENKAITAITPRKPKLYFGDQLLTHQLIDDLAKDPNVTLSIAANMRNGDGRVIPWIEKKENGKTTTLKIKVDQVNDKGEIITDAKGNPILKELDFNIDKTPGDGVWDDDMYKSFFLEWFGAIDHYLKGYMYYAGDIRHHEARSEINNDFYGTVRNHSYKFRVESINSLGIPVDDPEQLIIPGLYNYRDQIMVYLMIETYHQKTAYVDVP